MALTSRHLSVTALTLVHAGRRAANRDECIREARKTQDKSWRSELVRFARTWHRMYMHEVRRYRQEIS